MKTFVFVILMFLSIQIVQTRPAWNAEFKQREAKTAPAAAQKSERRESMRKFVLVILMFLWSGVDQAQPAWGNEFKQREAKIAEYKKWLDTLGPQGSQFWVRLDARRRPHKLYLGDGFYRADFPSQERFVDTFSNYLAGHPEKFMLIDLFDADTNRPVGEYGFGGFKLYAKQARTG
jgi:hypothetical protein